MPSSVKAQLSMERAPLSPQRCLVSQELADQSSQQGFPLRSSRVTSLVLYTAPL